MLMMTNERCPECNQISYMVIYPKQNKKGEYIVHRIRHLDHSMGDGCYLDNDGVLCIVRFDEDTYTPDYYCIHCEWHS